MGHSFGECFRTLTGYSPFPWQSELYSRFIADHANNIPPTADLPTGLGKTSVIAVWLLALINRSEKMPGRLIYVVNRRTVVDQTTAEVERLRENLPALGSRWFDSLAISTLRGQFAENQEWREDPSRPAVICGTVDMIGSRLLFEGYRIGFKSRPLHAGFLGQDALLVHDEAHLEPAFQKLVETIQGEQRKERERNGALPWPGLCVMALSATARDDGEEANAEHGKAFGLTDEEKHPPDAIPDSSAFHELLSERPLQREFYAEVRRILQWSVRPAEENCLGVGSVTSCDPLRGLCFDGEAGLAVELEPQAVCKP